MVGIFLRLLEYHQGVMFLTTNRVKCFDEAFHSRISVALKYEDLDSAARAQVWGNFFEAAQIKGVDSKDLASHELNGRQIRNVIQLARALADREKTGVDISRIYRHFKVTSAYYLIHPKNCSRCHTVPK
jgi:hypothetical protein